MLQVFEVDVWLNSHIARLTNPEVLGSNPSSDMFFSSLLYFLENFLPQDLFAAPFLHIYHTWVSMIGPCKSGCITSVLKQA